MKKVLMLMLVSLMLGLTACGNKSNQEEIIVATTEEVKHDIGKEIIVGSWASSSYRFKFDDDYIVYVAELNDKGLAQIQGKGTYQVNDNIIKINCNSKDYEIEAKYDSNTLCLYCDGTQLEFSELETEGVFTEEFIDELLEECVKDSHIKSYVEFYAVTGKGFENFSQVTDVSIASEKWEKYGEIYVAYGRIMGKDKYGTSHISQYEAIYYVDYNELSSDFLISTYCVEQ